MRLIILSLLIGYCAAAQYLPELTLALSTADIKHGLTALAVYLFIEGLLASKRSLTLKRFKRHLAQQSSNEPQALQAAQTALDQANDKLANLTQEQATLRDQLAQAKHGIKNLETQIEQHRAASIAPALIDQQAITLLGLLQNKGRLIDFLMQDIARYEDAKVGSVARYVHEGCRKVLKEHFAIEPVHSGTEGESIKVTAPFNPLAFKLTGKISSQPPYAGKVLHKGWKSTSVRLPQPAKNADQQAEEYIIAPAEIECA